MPRAKRPRTARFTWPRRQIAPGSAKRSGECGQRQSIETKIGLIKLSTLAEDTVCANDELDDIAFEEWQLDIFGLRLDLAFEVRLRIWRFVPLERSFRSMAFSCGKRISMNQCLFLAGETLCDSL